MFTHVSVQEVSPECQDWKEHVASVEGWLDNMQQAEELLQADIDEYQAVLNQSCDLDCPTGKSVYTQNYTCSK